MRGGVRHVGRLARRQSSRHMCFRQENIEARRSFSLRFWPRLKPHGCRRPCAQFPACGATPESAGAVSCRSVGRCDLRDVPRAGGTTPSRHIPSEEALNSKTFSKARDLSPRTATAGLGPPSRWPLSGAPGRAEQCGPRLSRNFASACPVLARGRLPNSLRILEAGLLPLHRMVP